MAEIHNLQEASIELLRDLYAKDNLRLTQAMLTVERGYYPLLESVLSTLDYYSEQDRVKAFVEEYQEVINDAKESLIQKKDAGIFGDNSTSATSASFSDIFDETRDRRSVYEVLKKVSFSDLEDIFSNVVSELCDEEFKVSIDAISHEGGNIESNVKLEVIIN